MENLIFWALLRTIPLHEKCLSTEFFLVRIFYIQSEYRKIRTRKNYVLGHFSSSVSDHFGYTPDCVLQQRKEDMNSE